MAQFKHLLAPGNIGNMKLKNHVIMGPVETLYASSDGEMTQRIIDFYVRRSRGGAGLIVLHSMQGNTKMDPIDPYPGSLRLDDNAYIPMLTEFTETMHREGTKVACLVSPGGGAQALGYPYDKGSQGIYDIPNVGPSEKQSLVAQRKVRKLTIEEIKKSVIAMGLCAARAKTAGFDAFCIHAVGGYLIAQFLTPYFNDRDDEYGGSLENRMRFLLEIIESCQKNAGKDFPLIVRFSIDEYLGDAGRGIEESKLIGKMLEKAGVAAIDCSAGVFETANMLIQPIYVPKGGLVPLAVAMKSAVSIPVIAQGRLSEPEIAEKVLAEGQADFISTSRGWLVDQDWVNKITAGDTEGLRRCISCNYCIGQRIFENLPIRCALNPIAGRESIYNEKLPSPAKLKKVIVIGAGPAGLEAAYRLGMQGHTVDIYEASDQICGGQIFIAQVPPCKDVLSYISRFYSAQLSRLANVTLHLNTKMTESNISKLDGDAVILATGGEEMIPGIPGIDNSNVVTAQNVLLGKCDIGKNVLIAGGGQIGAETAHYLAEKNHSVTIVEMLPEIALDEEFITRMMLLSILEEAGVKMLKNHRITSFTPSGANVLDQADCKEKFIACDTIVLALGTKPVNDLEKVLREYFSEVYVVGDACGTGAIHKAVEEGFFAALRI